MSSSSVTLNLVVTATGVTAEIKTGQRSVISYLLSQVMKYAHEGMSER